MLFRTLLFSSSTAFVQSRRTIFTYYYLSYVKFILRHSLSYDKLKSTAIFVKLRWTFP